MPAARPRASFEPIPPDFDVRTFVETAENFQYVDRISYEMIANNGTEQFEKLILLHVIIGGKPLVIDGFEEVLDPWTFTPSWLRDNHGDKVENARNLTSKENIPLTIKHFLKHLNKLTDQFSDDPECYRDKTRQRIYLKDIDCPQVWQDKLKDHIPSGLYYLNESTGELAGPGALDEPGVRKGRGIARAGDLMSSLPPEMRAENLQCYIGHEGTYTPAHREMCASLGQNIMVNASAQIGEDGKPERPGSSLWFMTETKDRHLVSEYWLSKLGHDIEVEDHFAQLIAWKKAPFKTYVVEQRPGDFILIPPLAPHQVWNRGTRTMKIAWNRTTVETLELALTEALPASRVVCRDEQYKNKAIVYYTLSKYSTLLRSARAQVEMGGEQAEAIQRSVKIRQVQRDFKRLFELYKSVLLSEMVVLDSNAPPEFLPFDSNVTCAYCRCNIFNRFLSCKACKNLFSSEIEEPYDICMDCYCMGRSCGCQSGYVWVEQWKWKDLLHKYEEWRAQIIDIDGHMTEKTPLPLQEERRYLGKKTLAQVCQEQLRVRPFVDIKNPPCDGNSDDESRVVDEYGNIKKVTNRKNKQWLNKHKSCHFCLHRHPKWKMAFCSNCDLAYCYGTLFRAHDTMPLDVMENPNWKCPHCRRVCNTGACRRDPRQHPHEPKGTLLGHDTKKVADVRSVECLVDFSVSNLNFMREDEGMDRNVMQRRLQQAELDKQADPLLDARYIDEDSTFTQDGIAYSPVEDAPGDFDDDTPLRARNGYSDGTPVNEAFFNEPDMRSEIPRLGQKRHREDDVSESINKRTKKKKIKKKGDDITPALQPKHVSGKEYQKEVQRKLLEDAKRDDRSILVAARMYNKSKIVTLSLSSGFLDRISRRPVLQHAQIAQQHLPEAETDSAGVQSILQSDVVPRENITRHIETIDKAAKTFRFRVEEDGAYSTRKRDKIVGGTVKRRSRGSNRFEEVTVNSDDDVEDDFDPELIGAPRARASNWLARKNEGEVDGLPTELPPDFKDGDVRSARDKERRKEYHERKKAMPPKPKAGIRPIGRPPNRLSQAVPEDYLDKIETPLEEESSNDTVTLAQQAAKAALAARRAEEEEQARVNKEAEENLRAKIAIFDGSGDEGQLIDGFLGDLPEEEELVGEDLSTTAERRETIPLGPPQATNSILGRPGMSGKKIKVVSASKKRDGSGATIKTTNTTVAATTLGFTSVNKVVRTVDMSDSDNDASSPADAPARDITEKAFRRSMMIPTRGSAAGKRGRGRPRRKI